MKFKMWCLINTKSGRPISIGVDTLCGLDSYVIGFDTRKSLLNAIADEAGEV